MKTRKLLCALLTLCLALGLVAPAALAAAAPVEITFWHSMDGAFADLLNKQVDLFNTTLGAEKGIKVTPVFQDWPGTTALTAAMTAKDVANMPDVIQLYGESVSIIRDYERTVWAEDKINAADSTVKKEDLIPNAVNTYSIGGKMIGVPYNISALMLYYNKTYFEQAGIAAPPKTIAEMAEMLPVLVEKTDAEFGLNVRVNEYELENFIATQGAEGTYFGDNESGHSAPMTKLACAEDGSLKNFLTEWQKVIASGGYKAVRDSINEEFASGMHAMVIMTSSRIPTIAGLVGDAFQWDVAPIPTVSADDKGGAFPSGAGLFMLNRDDDAKVAAAWEFEQFMISPEAQALWLESTGYIPVNVHAADTDTYKTAVAAEPRLEAPYNVLMQSAPTMVAAFCPNSGDVDGVIKSTMMSFADGSLDLDGAYQAITEGAQKAFDDYYRANPIK